MAIEQADTLEELDRAWDHLMEQLSQARAAMKDPACFPPPAGDRSNAEGYRYMLGHLHRLIETEVQQDPEFPYIQHHPSLTGKYTIDNADCLYLFAPLNPQNSYRLSGKCADHSHWQGTRNPGAAVYAPNYVIFETHSVAPGDSGTVQELFDGSRVVVDKIDSFELQVDPDGRFELLIAPDRPEGYSGNFIASTARAGTALPRGDVAKQDVGAYHFYIRELFGDWENERALEDLHIEKIGAANTAPPARTARKTAQQLRKLGDLVNNHMRYWTTMYGQLLDPYQQSGEQRPSYLPVNDLYPPRLNSTQGGGGQSTNAMTGGIFKLNSEQALICEFRFKELPLHFGFHLGNYWGESYDFANRVTSLNHLQIHQNGDGCYRIVVSAKDPGIQNWLDTADYESGYLTIRFTYPTGIDASLLPEVSTRLVEFDELKASLPTDTPTFSATERAQQIKIRQLHVARRYRQY